MKSRKGNLIVSLALSALVLSGCGHFKSKDDQDFTDEGAQSTAVEDQTGFSEYGFSKANRLKAPYNQSYYFDFDHNEVSAEDIESLKVQAAYAVANPSAKLRIEGNADERGSREYNVALGWRRAKAVSSILKQNGLTDAQLVVISYGKEKPLALGHDEESYNQNRRVDLIYEAK